MASGNNAQDDHESISRMADRLDLKGRARTDYIHKHMTGLGHKAVVQYTDAEEDDDDDAGGFFSSNRNRNRNRRRRSRDDDDDDDYPFGGRD